MFSTSIREYTTLMNEMNIPKKYFIRLYVQHIENKALVEAVGTVVYVNKQKIVIFLSSKTLYRLLCTVPLQTNKPQQQRFAEQKKEMLNVWSVRQELQSSKVYSIT